MSTSATAFANTQPKTTASRSKGLVRNVLTFVAILLGLWLLSPALHPVHVEAFSARSQSLAIMDMQGKVALDDQAYPVNIEYFFGLRLGTVKLLEWIMRLTHSTGDLNFHLLTTCSFLLLLGSSFRFAWRWAKSPLWAAVTFAILTPGLIEIAFFFSDNLPSAALAAFATALVIPRASLPRWFLIGLLAAGATLCRSDGMLAIPGVLLVSFLGAPSSLRSLAPRWLAFAAGLAALFYLSWRSTGMSLLHTLAVSRWISNMHFAESRGLQLVHASLAMFFGLPSILLLLLGVWKLWKKSQRREKIVLLLYPTGFYLYFMTKAIEPRNFLLLGAPFLVLLGAEGVQAALQALRGPNRTHRNLAIAGAAASLLLWVLPPRISISDGPRTILGHLWSPLLWRQWQGTIEDDMQRYNAFLDGIKPGERVLVLGVSFQAERYFHLQLLKAGYTLEPHSDKDAFHELVDVYRLGNKVVLQVRNEQPFAIYTAANPGMSFRYPQEFQLSTELAALKPADYDRAVMMTWGDQYFFQEHVGSSTQFQRQAGPQVEVIPALSMPAIRRNEYGKLRIIPMTAQDLDQLQQLSIREMQQEEQQQHIVPLRSYAVLQHALGCHYCADHH